VHRLDADGSAGVRVPGMPVAFKSVRLSGFDKQYSKEEPMYSRAIVWTGPGTVELQKVEISAPGPGEVLMENVITLVSPGTEAEWLGSAESHVVLGTTFPFVPGYSRVGRVIGVGEGVEGCEFGDRVAAAFDNLGRPLGAHASRSLVRVTDLDRIPDGVSFEQASFFLLGQTAAFVVMLGQVGLSDSVAIVGQGPIGNLAVQFARAVGAADILALDIVGSRRELALGAGATAVLDPADEKEFGAVLERTRGYAKTIDLSGSPSGTNAAIRLAAPGGTVVLSTGFAGQMSLDYGSIFIKGLRLIGGFVNTDPELARRGTRSYLRLLAGGVIDASALLSDPFPPEKAPEVYRRVLEHDRSLSAPLFRWRED
jgi:(R,R)-butanediol dehydrogenase/meso-butanediol dehydrogenase/diacetyl reductase